MEAHHSSSHHEHHHEGHHHGQHHGHQAKHFSDQERALWGLPKSAWNKCTDEFLTYKTCVVKKGDSFYPFGFMYNTHWADRWTCKDEMHLYQECYLGLIEEFQAENKLEIAARR